MDSFTGKFPDRGNLYQQLALGHLNLRRCETCMSVLWLYLILNTLLNTFDKFSCWTEFLKMLLSLALLKDGIKLILKSEVLALKVYSLMLH